MTDTEILEAPIIKRKVKINEEARIQLLSDPEEESQVVLHFIYRTKLVKTTIRIWNSTFLCDCDSSHRSALVHSENIAIYPVWMDVYASKPVHFTLIFKGLPKSCTKFDFIEDIPEPGGFVVRNIARNDSDIYNLDI